MCSTDVFNFILGVSWNKDFFPPNFIYTPPEKLTVVW